MKRAVLFFLLLAAGTAVWWIGFTLDRWVVESATQEKAVWEQREKKIKEMDLAPARLRAIDQMILRRDWKKAEEILDSVEKTSPEFKAAAAYRRAEILYHSCERHLVNFNFFADNKLGEQAGEERDAGSRKCGAAKIALESLAAGAKDKEVLFHVHYALGNLGVRRAGLALSRDELSEAVNNAIESYISALRVRDDYETRFNLELLLNFQQERGVGQSGKEPLDPKEFKIRPYRQQEGASPASKKKSTL